MKDDELLALLSSRSTRSIHVCHIEDHIASAIGASTTAVWLSKATVVKQFVVHRDIKFEHYRMLPIVLRYGAAVLDRKHHVTVVYPDTSIFDCPFKATIKATGLGTEIYTTTFHVVAEKKIPKILARGPLLRELQR